MSAEPTATALLLVTLGGLMALSVASSRPLGRLGVPIALIFIVLGMLAGTEGIGRIAFDDYAFVDYGSGKGKALLLASNYPFRSIVGVEYSAALTEAARSNIRHYRNRAMRCRNIEALHADARSYEPPAGPLLCFFFNPFDVSVWREVLARLEASVKQSPRPVHLVYVNVRDVAELEDLFPQFAAFAPVVATRTVRVLSAFPQGRP